MTDPLPTFAALNPRAEFYTSLEGPNSGGGRSVIVVGDRVYVVVYGDESTLPGGAEQVCAGATTVRRQESRVQGQGIFNIPLIR